MSTMPTAFLTFTRLAIIGWVWFSLLPIEVMFEAVEEELTRRGVDLPLT